MKKSKEKVTVEQTELIDRHIALVLDNHSSHSSLELSNIKVIKLPPGMTSKPLDAGIIFKA